MKYREHKNHTRITQQSYKMSNSEEPEWSKEYEKSELLLKRQEVMKWIMENMLEPLDSYLGNIHRNNNNVFVNLAYNIEHTVYILSKDIDEYMNKKNVYQRCMTYFEDRKNRLVCYVRDTCENEICSICLETIQIPVLTTCKHIFCRRCILTYYLKYRLLHEDKNVMCPNCREDITEDTFPVIIHKKDLEYPIVICEESKK